MSRPDIELVTLAQAGNMKAFDELVGLHQKRVYALAYRILNNCEDASDIQQETFISSWRNIRKFRGESSFATWLHKITVNLCLSRKRRRQTVALEPFMEENLTSFDGSYCMEATDTSIAVRKVLAAMPVHYRVLLILKDMEGRSFEEIAQILKCSVSGARTRASRARCILRDKMRSYLAEDTK